ncbi:hypothetical protein [Kiloniella sp.]|uniref:hypothetical protein n=1 Tax=Kiloniella sp. TaxID=1938587 RepID=UPI003B01592B
MTNPFLAETNSQDIFLLTSSKGEQKSFVVGLEWIAQDVKAPSSFEIYKAGQDMKASAFVPCDYQTGFYTNSNTQEAMGLPSLAQSLLSLLDTDQNIILVLANHSASDNLALIEINNNAVLRGRDRQCTLQEALHTIGSKQGDVDKIVVSSDLKERLEHSDIGNVNITDIDFLNTDLLFKEDDTTTVLTALPFAAFSRHKQKLKTGVIACGLLVIIGTLFYDSHIKPLVFPPQKIVQNTPLPKALTTVTFPSSAVLLNACHEAYYDLHHIPLGWIKKSITCRANPLPKSDASKAGLTKSQIIVDWALPSKTSISLLRPIAEASFTNWDYGIVLDKTAQSRNQLVVSETTLKRANIP